MEYQKIINLLDTTSDNVPRFITKKWIEVHDQSGGSYNTNKQIRFKTSMLQSDLCDYSDAYIVVRETITVINPNDDAYDEKFAAFQKLIIHLLIMQKLRHCNALQFD